MDPIAPSPHSLPPHRLHPLGLPVVDYFIFVVVLYFFILIGYASMRLLAFAIDHWLNWLSRKFGLGDQPDLEAGENEKPRDRPERGNEKLLLEAHGTNVNRYCYDGCVICLEEFRPGEPCTVLDSCQHMFHPDCIAHWLVKNNTCPVCRKSSDLDVRTVRIV